uniref:elongation factor 1-delta isoform X2 n=1 Tax=Myxine glutinosa TaxID=7769 RepID=UPI00358E1895
MTNTHRRTTFKLQTLQIEAFDKSMVIYTYVTKIVRFAKREYHFPVIPTSLFRLCPSAGSSLFLFPPSFGARYLPHPRNPHTWRMKNPPGRMPDTVWMDKYKFDDAERVFQEGFASGRMSERARAEAKSAGVWVQDESDVAVRSFDEPGTIVQSCGVKENPIRQCVRESCPIRFDSVWFDAWRYREAEKVAQEGKAEHVGQLGPRSSHQVSENVSNANAHILNSEQVHKGTLGRRLGKRRRLRRKDRHKATPHLAASKDHQVVDHNRNTLKAQAGKENMVTHALKKCGGLNVMAPWLYSSESIWWSKVKCDDAEARYHENLQADWFKAHVGKETVIGLPKQRDGNDCCNAGFEVLDTAHGNAEYDVSDWANEHGVMHSALSRQGNHAHLLYGNIQPCNASESVMDHGVWMDKYKFDDAERCFHEKLPTPPKKASIGEQHCDVTLRLSNVEKENQELRAVVADLQKSLSCLERRLMIIEGNSKNTHGSQTSQHSPHICTIEILEENGGADSSENFDLFGSDEEEEEEEEEEDAETKRVREERLKQYQEKKSKKAGVVAKSSIVLDVKPWDDETDMANVEEVVRSVKMDGLLWGASKLVPIGYGIKKLQIQCVVEDDKVGVDILEEEITKFEDLVQSVDVAAFNKI